MTLGPLSIAQIHDLFIRHGEVSSMSREQNYPIENLVFEGGGIKGLAYGGAVEVLEERDILKDVKRVAGSSAGGITAMLLCLGYNSSEITRIMSEEIDFQQLMDRRVEWDPTRIINAKGMKAGISDIVMLFKNKGLYKGDAFVAIAKGIVKRKIEDNMREAVKEKYRVQIQALKETSSEKEIERFIQSHIIHMMDKYYITDLGDITFSQLEKLNQDFPDWNLKSLYVTGTNLTNGSLKVFSAETDPNMKVVDAVRITMSFPFGFEPVEYQGHYYADGGIADNYPMHIFNAPQYLSHGRNQVGVNPCTLGFLVDSEEEIAFRWGGKAKAETLTLPKFIGSLLKGVHNRSEILRELYNVQSIQINDLGVPTMDFNLDEQTQAALLQAGKKPTRFYFDNYYGKRVGLTNLPDYESLQERYYSKGYKELDRIVNEELWPLLNEFHNLNIALNALNTPAEKRKINRDLSRYQSQKIEAEKERLRRIENIEADLTLFEIEIKRYDEQLEDVWANIRECQDRLVEYRIKPSSLKAQNILKEFDQLMSRKCYLEEKLKQSKDKFNQSMETLELEKQNANLEIFTLVHQLETLDYLSDSSLIDKLKQTELELHAHMDIAINAIREHQRNYPDPRSSDDFEKELFVLLEPQYEFYLGHLQKNCQMSEADAKEQIPFVISLTEGMMRTGLPLEKVHKQINFFLSNVIVNGKMASKENRDEMLMRTLAATFLESQYIKGDRKYDEFLLDTFKDTLKVVYKESNDWSIAILKAHNAVKRRIEELRMTPDAESQIQKDSIPSVRNAYANSLIETAKKLTSGTWGDQITLENLGDVHYNQRYMFQFSNETIGKHETNYHVKKVEKNDFEQVRTGLIGLKHTPPPVRAFVLTPENAHLQNPNNDPKEIIVTFPTFEDNEQTFSMASLFNNSRKEQFAQTREAIINQIVWSIRQAKEHSVPHDAKFMITIQGEGLGGQDAQYCLQALLREIEARGSRHGLSDISNINLVLEDPSRVDVSDALELRRQIEALQERGKCPKIHGTTIYNQTQISYNLWKKRKQTYIGQANILSFLDREQAEVYLEKRDIYNNNHSIETNSNIGEPLIEALNEDYYLYSSAWFRHLYLAYKTAQSIISTIFLNIIPSTFTFLVTLPFKIGLNIIKRFTNPFVRLFKRFRKRDEEPEQVDWMARHQQLDKTTPISRYGAKRKPLTPKQLSSGIEDNKHALQQIIDQSSASTRLRREQRPPIENIVLEGGGVKGVAYAGALESMQANGLLKDVKRVAGSSAGGITAALMALGYSPAELKEILLDQLNFSELMDEPINLAGIDTLLSVNGMDIGIAGIISLFRNKGLYKGDAFCALMQNLISDKLTQSMRDMFLKQLTIEQIQAITYPGDTLTQDEKNERIQAYLDHQISFVLNEEGIENIGEISMGQLKRLRQKYPELGILDVLLTATDLHDGSQRVLTAEADEDLPLYKAVRMTMSFPGGFMPVEYEGRWYADGGISNNYPMEVFDKADYLTHGVNDAGVNPCTLGILVDSQDEINSRWGIPPDAPAHLTLPSFIQSVIGGMHNRSEILREKYNINSVQIIDDISEDDTYKPAATMDLNITDTQKRRLVQNGIDAMEFYYKNYHGQNVLYASTEHYENLYQKYFPKSTLELMRIYDKELKPAISELRAILPQLDTWERELNWSIETAESDPDLETLHTLHYKLGSRQYQLDLALKEISHFTLELEQLEDKVQRVGKSLAGVKGKLAAGAEDSSYPALEKKLSEELIVLQEALVHKRNRQVAQQEKIRVLQEQIQVLKEEIAPFDDEIIAKYKQLEVNEKNLELIEQLRHTLGFLLSERDILDRALRAKGEGLPPEPDVIYASTAVVEPQSIEPRKLAKKLAKPIVFSESSHRSLQVFGKDNESKEFYQRLSGVFEYEQWRLQMNDTQSIFSSEIEPDHYVSVDMHDDWARVAGNDYERMKQCIQSYHQSCSDSEYDVAYDIEAKSLQAGITLMTNLHKNGFDISEIAKLKITGQPDIEGSTLKRLCDDIKQRSHRLSY